MHVSDPGNQLGSALDSVRMRSCVAKRAKLEPVKVEVEADIDAGGHLTHPAVRTSEPVLTTCLVRQLPELKLACSADGKAHHVTAQLDVSTFGPLGPKNP